MTIKKNAINISIGMILLSLIIILLSWNGRDEGITELLYVLASGVFGSSFATLWIFIYEYHQIKNELLKSIFEDTVSVMEDNGLHSLERFGFYEPKIKASLEHKFYMQPINSDSVQHLSKEDRCLYELCRFVDATLEIDYNRIKHICDMIESIDFWSDAFRHNSKYRDAIIHKVSLPLYEVFISAPAMEDGYLFRYFKDFRHNYEYSADRIYEFVCELDKAMYSTEGNIKYEWQKSNANLRLHMHEKMWIFRDAFYSPHRSRRERREAVKAFLNDTHYKYVR